MDKEIKESNIDIEKSMMCKENEKDKEKDKENEMDCEIPKIDGEISQRSLLKPSSITIISPGISVQDKEKEKEKEKGKVIEREKGKESDVEVQYVCVGSMKRPAMSLTRFLRETEKRRRAVLDDIVHVS